MAKIVDPDDLNQQTEVVFDTTGKTIQILTGGTITDGDGVALQCVYSFTKEEWKSDTELIKFPFPFIAITAEQFELVQGWDWKAEYSKDQIKDGGWALKNVTGGTEEEYMNLTTLGSFNDSATDRAYYQQYTDGPATDTVYPGEVNQAIKIFGGSAFGNFDYKDYFKIYLREQGKIYDFYDLMTEQNLTQLTYRKYALPLSNSIDLKITHGDAQIAASGSTPDQDPYDNMSITYYTTGQTRDIGGTDYYFTIIIDGSGGTAEQIYEFVQWSLRQEIDIDASTGSTTGKTAEELLEFIGDTLRTKYTSLGGVYIDNFLQADTNRLEFTDDGNNIRTFPYIATGDLLFNDNLASDAVAKYWVFFTDANGNTYGSTTAIIVEDNDTDPISGYVSGRTSVSFTFDYDNNIQGGRTPETDAAYTAVAIGLSTAQFVSTTGSIARVTTNVINFVAALERNYLNP